MKGMNNIIVDTQEQIEVITGKLNTVLRTKERVDQLDAKMSSYMNQSGALDLAKDQLDKLAFDLVVDLDGVILEALADIEADEEEVDAYAAMFAEDDLSEEGLDSQKLEELLDKEEQAAKEVTLEEIGIDQEGGADE